LACCTIFHPGAALRHIGRLPCLCTCGEDSAVWERDTRLDSLLREFRVLYLQHGKSCRLAIQRVQPYAGVRDFALAQPPQFRGGGIHRLLGELNLTAHQGMG
jgi:hypothetical protein